MELRDLNIICKRVPDFINYSNGNIKELFLVHKKGKSAFFVNVEFTDLKNRKKRGLFSYDLKKGVINSLNSVDCLEYLQYIKYIDTTKTFLKIIDIVKDNKKDKVLIEWNNQFVYIDETSLIKKLKSTATITIKDNEKTLDCDICVLNCSQGLNTNYVLLDCDKLHKNELNNIDYSVTVDLSIKVKDDEYFDCGNIKKTVITDDKIFFLIEPLESSLLSRSLLGELNFKNISPGEIISIMLNTNKTAKVGKIDLTNNVKRKFKYITILNNFEIYQDEIFVGDVIFSKKIRESDFDKIKPNSSRFVYVSIFVTADNISIAKDIAINKINNIKNFIELIEKNSSIFEMYNKGCSISNWDIDNLFVDYKLSDNFYIYNVLDSSQCIFGSNKNIVVRNFGSLNSNSEIMRYKNQLEKIVFRYEKRESKLFNAMFWLNKSLEVINNDIAHSVIYLNIAIEYVTNGEKCLSLIEENPEITSTVDKIKELIDNEDIGESFKNMLRNKINSMINDSSVNKKFDALIKRLGIEFTDKQFKNYKLIRQARNDIIHNNKDIDVTQHNVIDCYMMISKVIFFKITEGQDEYI